MKIDERIVSYLAMLARHCKGCYRKSESACAACPIQPAAGLLQELGSGAAIQWISRSTQVAALRAAILIELQQHGEAWVKTGVIYRALKTDYPQLTHAMLYYNLRFLPIERRGATRAGQVRLRQEGVEA